MTKAKFTMTQAELESIVQKMRAIGLRSSWQDLMQFSKDVVGGLVEAYQALLRNAALSDKISPSEPNDVQKVVRDKLAIVLTLLTSKAQVARWESEILAGNNIPGTQGAGDSHAGGPNSDA